MAQRTAVEADPRGDTGTAWEVFVREHPDEALIHVGNVTAPSAGVADEMAGDLFDDPVDVWLCPAAEMHRFTAREHTSEAPSGVTQE